ncbi:MAG: VCBS repeat-containing protein [Thermoanaerobaculia bacterium]|nr:VCBS repeat-containing protein [Thermoanaerobaculia bacterium]
MVMVKNVMLALVLASGLLWADVSTAGGVAEPVLKWQRGGCFNSWCQTGWYGSPSVADIDGDGQVEVIWASYDLVSLDGATGSLEWRASNGSRSWASVVVADLTADGDLEIVVGRGSDQLTVYDHLGGEVWSRNPFGSGEIRTLAAADLESDGQLEILVARASSGGTEQMSVYQAGGSVRPGWPARRSGEPGFGAGMYNQNMAIADLDGDGIAEIVGPTDTHYITTLDPAGDQIPANAIYGENRVWSQVGVHVDHEADLRGFAMCGTEHRPNFANAAPSIADMDGDGSLEIVVVGDVYDCSVGDPAGDLYYLPFILELDRTRWSGAGYDWTVIPQAGPGTGPLSQDYHVIENSVTNAVLADLDGDGEREILYSSYDGKVHAYWLDKTEHGNWPYSVPGVGIRFAGEPVVVDIDRDGSAEVLFTSWPEKTGNRVGQLHVLDSAGNSLHAMDLPAPFSGDWNGGLAAPTLANLDQDPDLELVIGTASSGVVAYDLPSSSGAVVLWGTGRGGPLRTGTPSGATIFVDGFESGNVNAWSSSTRGPSDP